MPDARKKPQPWRCAADYYRRPSLLAPVFKLIVLFAHLLGTSLALGAIVATDIRLLGRLAQARVRIAPPNPFVMRLISSALVLLYLSGGCLVWLGWSADPAYLSNPKLQGKLLLVLLLSVNALVLHHITFPGLARGRRVARWKARDFMRVALPVALSNALWMYCAFLGIARPWNHTVTLEFVLTTGAAVFGVALAGVCALLAVAAQDRTGREPGRIDAMKRQMAWLAGALRV
jgi:hypothetical protein